MLKHLAVVLLISFVLRGFAFAADDAAPPAGEVTITGALMLNIATVPDPKAVDQDQLVIFAVDGSPEIKSQVDKIVADDFPDKGLDADSGPKLLDQWNAHLKFYISKDGAGAALYSKKRGESSFGETLQGTISEKDGKHWLTVSKVVADDIYPGQFTKHYPAKFLQQDKPTIMPDKDPLILKVKGDMTLKCYKLPAGKYQEGSYFFMVKRFPEEYPHLVTLTKPYYLAEIPVTQEMFEAVIGSNPSSQKGPTLPVRDMTIQDINKFCQILSDANGKKVRLPTDAEWEYAARVGLCNPDPPEVFADQDSSGPKRTALPVKSKAANAWGFYDMESSWWEVVADRGFYNPRTSQVDQFFSPGDESTKATGHRGRGLIAYNHSVATLEFMSADLSKMYAGAKFRVAVDAEK